MTFQPRRTTGNIAAPGGLKPAQFQVPARLWTGAKIRQITSVKAAAVPVKPMGVSITRPAAARGAQVPVTVAGGAR